MIAFSRLGFGKPRSVIISGLKGLGFRGLGFRSLQLKVYIGFAQNQHKGGVGEDLRSKVL